MIHPFKNVGEKSVAKNYHLVSILSVVCKVYEKLVNNKLVDYLEKCGIFTDFQYGFRSRRSTADLLRVVSDTIARAFNSSGASRAVALDISKTFNRAWHTDILCKLKCYGISGQIFGLICILSVIDRFEWLWMGSLQENIQLMLSFIFLSYHSILGPDFSYYTKITFLMM